MNFVLREEFALLFQTFSRNDLPGEAALARGRSVFKKGRKKKKFVSLRRKPPPDDGKPVYEGRVVRAFYASDRGFIQPDEFPWIHFALHRPSFRSRRTQLFVKDATIHFLKFSSSVPTVSDLSDLEMRNHIP